ncbi:MAG: phosphoenolpyruvate--protein phosphotransferase [Candidatus Riflebacteria bacterium]|nr:phosphoenolpyruvate--protein phosphotransferase [Candidatus Riflebacteria bacterium]
MLKGSAISPGIALGRVFCLKHFRLENVAVRTILENEVENEVQRFQQAIQLAHDEINQLSQLPQIKSSLEIANIFHAHLTLVDDPDLKKEVLKRIRERRQNVEAIVSSVTRDYSEFFKSLPDPQFQAKAIDIMDIGRRILSNCQDENASPLKIKPDEKVILVAEDITAADIAGFDTSMILGIATEEGTTSSHAAILARSLGIPALVQVKNLLQSVVHGKTIILDGNSGFIISNPTTAQINECKVYFEAFLAEKIDLKNIAPSLSITKDGVRIKLLANIGQIQDVDSVLTNQADGIGLYRTEFTYLIRKRFPTEKELINLYWSVIERMGDKEIVLRTIDLGGDKLSQLLKHPLEKNPELGWRAIRLSLDRPDVFRTQLRAIIKVSSKAKPGQVKVLIPMISGISELRKTKEFLGKLIEELKNEKVEIPEQIKFGVMIEVPSSALLADKIAQQVDFLSIGSNDLVQYTLAVDRTNSKVSHLYQPLNPAVLKLISLVVQSGEKHLKTVSICGELAGDPFFTILLLGLGLKELSMNSICIPKIKNIIRKISISEIKDEISKLLEMSTSEEVEEALWQLNKKYQIASKNV